MEKRVGYWVAGLSVLLAVSIMGCYKKELSDLDSLKNVSFKNEREYAFPLFEGSLTSKDSLPFSVPKLSLVDTIKTDFKLKSYLANYSGEVDYAELKISVKTNFPISANFQVYFVDASNTIIDSLLTVQNSVIDGADNGLFNETDITIFMDREKYKKIENAANVFIRYDIETSNSKQYAANQVDINAGIKFGITF